MIEQTRALENYYLNLYLAFSAQLSMQFIS